MENALGGSPRQMDAATAAAVRAVASGAGQSDAIRAAKQAWRHAGQPVAMPREGDSPPVPKPAAVRSPENSSAWDGLVRCRVSGFQQRTVRKTQSHFVGGPAAGHVQTRRIKLTVWTFWVDPVSIGSQSAGPIAVEMTGRRFKGTVTDGDEVRIDRRPRGGKTLRIKRIENLTTRETVRAKGGPPVGVAKLIVTAIQLAVLVAVIVVFLTVVLPHLKHLP